jgi:hypothetical protein
VSQQGTDTGTGVKVYEQKSEGVIHHLSRAPRILLGLLAAWTLLGVLTTAITASPLFMDNQGREIDGALAGMAFMWPGVALAAVYIYCAREPDRFPKVFWLAAGQQIVAIIAVLYHWLISEDFTGESAIVPLAGSGALLALTLAFISQDRDALAAEKEQAQTAKK